MSDKRKDQVVEYVTRLQDALGLASWDIAISDDPADEDDLISASIARLGEWVTWRFNWKAFFDDDPERQREAIVHELVHLHLQHTYADMLDSIERGMTNDAWQHMEPQLRRSYERTTDRLATVIAPKYDLPAWPKESGSDAQEHDMTTDKGRSGEAQAEDREPGTGIGDAGDASQQPDVNPGQADTEDDGSTPENPRADGSYGTPKGEEPTA